MRTRVISNIITVLILISLGVAGPVLSQKTEISILQDPHFIEEVNDVFDKQVQEWARTKGVKVTVERIRQADLITKIALAAETGEGPDIIAGLGGYFPVLYTGVLTDVTDLAEELGEKYGGWYPVGRSVCQIGGRWFAIPDFTSNNVIQLRTDLLAKTGEPIPTSDWTWEDLLRIAKKIKDVTDVWGAGFALSHTPGDASIHAYSVLWCYGGYEVEIDGRTVAINSPGTQNAVKFMRRLYQEALPPEVVGWDDGSNNRAFLAGKIAMTSNSASIYWAAKKDHPEIAKNMIQIVQPAGPAAQALYSSLRSFGIFKYCKYPDLAKDLLRYLKLPENREEWLAPAFGTMCPVLRKYGELPMWKENPILYPHVESMKMVRHPGWPGPVTREAGEVFSNYIIIDMFAKAAVLGESVEDAVRWAAEEMRRIYGTL